MIDLDLKGIRSPEELEDRTPISAGRHMAVVVSHHMDQKTGALKVVWRIESDPWAGAVLTETHNLPALAMEASKMPGLIRKLALFAYRMGLIRKEDMGKSLRLDPDKLIGVRRVIDVERKQAKDSAPDSPFYSNIAYGCYWSEDRPEIPVADRIRLGLPLLPGQSPPTAAELGAKVVTPPSPSKNVGVVPGVPSMAFDPSEI